MTQTTSTDAFARLKALLGPKGYTEDPAEIAPHLEEWRGKYHGKATLLVRPASTAEVSAVMKICHETHTAVVPQGGNTGLVGAQMPFHGEVIIDFCRMNQIRATDKDGASLTAEAGVVLADAQAAAEKMDLMLATQLASEGSCTVGGVVSTNAGGVNVLRYGMVRPQILGLEVVLADGTVLDMLRTLRKDNTGYDLKQLFIGAEGTLGLVTAAAFHLYPKPATRFTAFLAVPDVTSAVQIMHKVQKATGSATNAFELVPRIGIELVTRHIPETRDPFAEASPWYVLCEVSGMAALEEPFEEALGEALEAGLATDAVIAQSEAQREELWRLRESMSHAQKQEGSAFKHDIAVPVSAQDAFIAKALPAVRTAYPTIVPVVFGHLGDGNLHFNFMVRHGEEALLAEWDNVAAEVYKVVREFHGTISAEHGIGVMKKNELKDIKPPEVLALMRTLKRALDPDNILNPGKTVPEA